MDESRHSMCATSRAISKTHQSYQERSKGKEAAGKADGRRRKTLRVFAEAKKLVRQTKSNIINPMVCWSATMATSSDVGFWTFPFQKFGTTVLEEKYEDAESRQLDTLQLAKCHLIQEKGRESEAEPDPLVFMTII